MSTGPRVCASCLPRSRGQLEALRESRPADLVEVRLDGIEPSVAPAEVAELLGGFALPVVATCRSAEEGGRWRGDHASREDVLRAALACDVEAVDIELRAGCLREALADDPERVVVSHHLVEGADRLDEVVEELIELAPYRAKLVAAIARPDEAAAVLAAGDRLRAAGIRSLAFPMGEWSGGGRLLAALTDDWIYAADTGGPTAPGQWGTGELVHGFRVARWRRDHQRFGVVGDPLGHSLSPAVFNAAFTSDGAARLYGALPGPDFEAVMRLAQVGSLDGLSVTMPFKQAALDFAADATSVAREVGAANTLRRVGNGWEAHNTDVEGVAGALGDVELRGARATVIGAGGAARAAVVALANAGARVTVVARDPVRASSSVGDLPCAVAPLGDFGPGADVVVNATPVGMEVTDDSPVATTGLKGDEVVLDMIYRPQSTQLLRDASRRGCRIVGGLEMFLAQAAAQHRWWFGAEPPLDVMRAAAVARLQGEQGEWTR